jgi:predicted DNA-binding transcriptional regulator YafY
MDGARNGIAVAKLAAERGVHARTIKRDIDALCQAGFPLYDEKVNGTVMWKLRARPFRTIEESGLGLTELAALYFSRSILVALAGPTFQNDLERALMKVERALDAIVRERSVTMRYASASSGRTKEYVLEPQRLSYADGGVYLTAWVPEYRQLRNFALERVETFAVGDEGFVPRPLPVEPFANSIGVHTGPAEPIEIEFDRHAADYIRGREWHRSQEIEDRDDGSIRLRLEVCNDRPLRSWILSFGAQARVLAPPSLVREIGERLEQARRNYRPRPAMTMARMSLDEKRVPAQLERRSAR